MDKGRTEQIIEKLIDSVEAGQGVPFAVGKVAVNKDETIMLLRELESIVNGELKIYREFNDRKGKIINDAKKEAADIIYEAEQTASRIRVTKRMSTIGTAFKAESLDQDDKQALRTAGDIYAASLIYTDEMLTEVSDVVAQAYDTVVNQYGRMIDTLQEKAELIAKNKAELMGSLKELSKEDRYTQILELGQLLSYELYSERMKAREMEKNGSYQMEMRFEEQSVPQKEGHSEVLDSAFVQPEQQTANIRSEIADSASAQPEQQTANIEPEIVDSAFVQPEQQISNIESETVDNKSDMVDSAFDIPEESVFIQSTDSAFSQPVDSAFSQPVDSAFSQPVDSAFVQLADSVFSQPADSAFVQLTDSAFSQSTDSAFVQQEVDSAFEEPKADSVHVQSEVAVTQMQESSQVLTSTEVDSQQSIESVSKTLEMFKNYKPGGKDKKFGKRRK